MRLTKNNMSLKICEIFPSIQGEGKTVGELAIFIRLSGCNLKCNFCDTPYHNEGKEMTNDEIVAEIRKYEIKRLVITGGLLRTSMRKSLRKAQKGNMKYKSSCNDIQTQTRTFI